MQFRVPHYRCRLGARGALVVNNPDAGLYVLADHTLTDDELTRLLDYQRIRCELFPHRMPIVNRDGPPDGDGAMRMPTEDELALAARLQVESVRAVENAVALHQNGQPTAMSDLPRAC